MLRSIFSRLSMAIVLMGLSGSLFAAAVDAFTAPGGGEVYIAGQVQRIHLLKGVLKSNVLIELSRDGGTTFATLGTIAGTLKTSPKEFLFDYTVSGAPTSSAVLRASGATTKGPVSVLSAPFAIATADVTTGGTIPTGGVITTSLADGSVTTPKIADKAVTPAKQGSLSASTGFVLTADGLGGAQYMPPISAVADGSVVNSSVSAAAGIVYTKLNLTNSITSSDIKDGTITNLDINPAAAIAYSKLNLAGNITGSDISIGAITDANVSPTAGIQYSKLNLTGSISNTDIKPGAIVDALVATNAAIQYSKLNLANSIVSSDIQAGAIFDVNVNNLAAIQYSKLSLGNSIKGSDLSAGTITDPNISPAAAIAYSKLNLSASIKGSDLAPGTITLDKISTAGATAGQVITFDGTVLGFAVGGGGGGGGFTLPVVKSQGFATTLLDLTNLLDASAGSFAINNAAATSAGLQGKTIGTGAGVSGTSALGDGVLGQSGAAAAIHGKKAGADTGSAGVFESTNTANTSDTLTVSTLGNGGAAATIESKSVNNAVSAVNVRHFGLGDALTVTAPNTASNANGITVNVNTIVNATTGVGGDGVNATASSGNGVTGTSNNTTAFAAGVEGDNNGVGPGVLGAAVTTNYGAITAANFAAGPGLFAYSTVSGGFGVYALAGLNSSNVIAGHFENRLATATANTLESISNAPNVALSVSSTSTTAGTGIQVTTATGAGSAALKIANGAVALGATNGYTSAGVVDNGYLIVTTAGALTLPTAAPLTSGTTVWVVNNSGGVVSVSNANNGPVNIAAGNAKQFVFISVVSATNWIPVQ